MRGYLIAICTVLLLVQADVYAQPVCTGDENLDAAEHLHSMRAGAVSVRALLCDGASQDEITTEFVAFLDDNAGWFDDFGGFQGGVDPLTVIKSKLASNAEFGASAVGIDLQNHLAVDGESFVPRSPSICEELTQDDTCDPVIREFKAFYTHAHNAYADGARRAFRETIVSYSGEWKEFIDSSRGFTLLESAINGYLYKRSETANFQRPPDVQWVVLHPAFVIENVSDAVDGQQIDEGLAIDVVGVNWWRQDKWYIPSGGALTAVYSDRPLIQDWGYGIALYFGDAYTIGATWHDSEQGIFISADLLKFLQDNKKVVDKFR